MTKDKELEHLRRENITLREQVALLNERIRALEAQLAKDSHNSHLPRLRIAFIGTPRVCASKAAVGAV